MEKFIPYEKLSKKKRREVDLLRRGTWGALNPVTRKPENPKAYNRQKARKRMCDPDNVSFVFLFSVSSLKEAKLLVIRICQYAQKIL